MEDLLKLLANVSRESQEDREITPEMEPGGDPIMMEENDAWKSTERRFDHFNAHVHCFEWVIIFKKRLEWDRRSLF